MTVEPDGKGKIAYMTAAVADGAVEFGDQEDLDPDLEAAIAWAAGKTPAQIMAEREATWNAVSQFATELGYALSLWCASFLVRAQLLPGWGWCLSLQA